MYIGMGGAVQSQSAITEDARHRFYAALEECAETVVEKLLLEPLAAYETLAEEVPEIVRMGLSWNSLEASCAPPCQHLRQVLKAWGEAHRLDEPWIYEDVLFTLRTWAKVDDPLQLNYQLFDGDTKQRDRKLRFARVSHGMIEPELPSFTFTFQPELHYQTLKEERARFDDELRKARQEYWGRLKTAIEEGWQKKPDEPSLENSSVYFHAKYTEDDLSYKKAPSSRVAELHFEWLVRYQVQGWSHSQILQAYPKNESELYEPPGISYGINNAAKLIGLTVRPPDSGGRPKNH